MATSKAATVRTDQGHPSASSSATDDDVSVRRPSGQTHDVFNQVPPFRGLNYFTQNKPLVAAVQREGAGWVQPQAARFGEYVDGAPQEWGDDANANPPVLRSHDRFGHRINQVEFHPSYHNLMQMSLAEGLASTPWRDPKPGAHVARATLAYITVHADAGHLCPVSGTFSAVPSLRMQPDLAQEWEEKLTNPTYDPANIAPQDKNAVTCAMGMTEKQGGSDVRANTTVATPVGRGGPGGEYRLTGHKWFFSAPMCDLALVLAQAPEGLSCFLVPRRMSDGTMNNFRLLRLKDKLGNRSNASSEIEFEGTYAQMVGEPGRGVPTIIEMVNYTRLECLVGSAAGMRVGATKAIHHARYRSAFGARVIDQPLMQNVLADLALESEAATIMAMRIARAYDDGPQDSQADLFRRLATAVSKYWLCKRLPQHAFEVLEAHGGNGYIEESGIPRLYRESPLMSVWEGTGNVMCLDVLRAMAKEPETLSAFLAEVEQASGMDPRLDAHIAELKDAFTDFNDIQVRARRLVEMMALGLQGSLLVRHGTQATADAFCASRLARAGGHEYGTLPVGTDFAAIIEQNSAFITD